MREKPKLRSRALRYINAVHAAGDRLDHETRAVLIALGSHLSQEDWYVWPHVRRLALMTELSESTVKRRRNQIIREHKLVEAMPPGFYPERSAEDRARRPMRRWRKGGRPPLCLKLDLVAVLRLRRGREGANSTLSAEGKVSGRPEAKVSGGPETAEGKVSG